ncbi:hypothetical protein ACFWWM_30630 [Streptomyces sp. NPDC058682]|uniref:hypothetical protein n=1 Tax=Streptomyces sp. NPDC058682 TaxID=3346596 RepID=UPI00364826A0
MLTGWTAETLGGLTLLVGAGARGWFRRRRAAHTTTTGPVGEKEEFELTDGVLPDDTYAAERVAVYRTQ